MIREAFNDGWRFGPRVSAFESFLGGEDQTREVTLPHDAMLEGGRSADSPDGSHTGYFSTGSWIYTRSFDVPQEWNSRRMVLEFEGVYRDAMVYVNGDLAGQCANGYTVFQVPIDDFVRFGESNTVRVEARAGADSRWYSGGGIIRPVHLLTSGLVHVDSGGLRVTTPYIDDELATVEVETRLRNDAHGPHRVAVTLEIRDPAGRVVGHDETVASAFPSETTVVRQRVHIKDPERWGPDSPSLYTAHVTTAGDAIEGDAASAVFGLRTISVDPLHGLRINGDTVKLRGACVHHDNGVIGAATFSSAEDRRVRLLKAAGFNALRSAHNPLSVAMLDACDRHGLIVMDETWDVWTQGKTTDDYSNRFAQWWERDVDALVAKDFNHPSVVFYSIGNEIQEVASAHGARRGRLIAERIRSLDPSRILTNSINTLMTVTEELAEMFSGQSEEAQSSGGDAPAPAAFNDIVGSISGMMDQVNQMEVVTEKLVEPASVVDVLGLNYAEGLYLAEREKFPHRIVLGSETFPSRVAAYWDLVTAHGHVIGDFTWTGWDYLGESGIGRPMYPGDPGGFGAAYPWLTASTGDLDITGNRRPVSHYREIVFGLTDEVYVSVQDPAHHHEAVSPSAWVWTDSTASWTWGVEPGTPIAVEAYCDADEVEFLVNGDSAARVPVGEALAKYAVADISYQPGTLEAVAFRAGVEVGRSSLSTAGAPVELRVTAEDQTAAGDDDPLQFLRVEVVDRQGLVNPIDDRVISVEVTGGAVLQGLGSARPSHEEDFTGNSCTTSQGRALIVARSMDATDATVIVRAVGLPEHTVTL